MLWWPIFQNAFSACFARDYKRHAADSARAPVNFFLKGFYASQWQELFQERRHRHNQGDYAFMFKIPLEMTNTEAAEHFRNCKFIINDSHPLSLRKKLYAKTFIELMHFLDMCIFSWWTKINSVTSSEQSTGSIFSTIFSLLTVLKYSHNI